MIWPQDIRDEYAKWRGAHHGALPPHWDELGEAIKACALAMYQAGMREAAYMADDASRENILHHAQRGEDFQKSDRQ